MLGQNKMRAHQLFYGLVILTGTCVGSDLEVRDKLSGEVVATFDSIEGGNILIAGRTYEVVPMLTETERRAFQIRVPKVRFRDATLREALEFLSFRYTEDAERKPVNLVLSNQEIGNRTVTLSMDDASYHALLEAISRMTDCIVEYRDESVVFQDAKHSK